LARRPTRLTLFMIKPPCGRRLVRRCPYRASAGEVGHRAHARETSKKEVVRAARLAEQHGSYFRRLALTSTRKAGALAADGLSDTRGLDLTERRRARRAQAHRENSPPPAIPDRNNARNKALVDEWPAAAVVRGCRRGCAGRLNFACHWLRHGAVCFVSMQGRPAGWVWVLQRAGEAAAPYARRPFTGSRS